MIDRSDKHAHHHSFRSDRQFRPVLNSIIFLIAANLVAKGALGLGAYQAQPIPNNIQGSLFLTLNSPGSPQQVPGQQFLPMWYTHPIASSTQRPRPISQTQIVNIGEPAYEEEEYLQGESYQKKLYINRYNSIEDPLEPASSEEIVVRTLPEVSTTEVNTEETTTINPDVELLPQNLTSTEDDLVEEARQSDTSNTTSSTTSSPPTTTRRTTTTATVLTEGASVMPSNKTNATMEGNITGVYGPPGFGTINLTYGPPGDNKTANRTNVNQNGTYSYLPAGNYGPYTGQENISIAYGPPVFERPVYQKPFFSSPEDPYLNTYNHNYNNFYDSPTYYPDMFKYNDIFKDFYNNYPSFYNNYLGK